jgi:hypothetical protein
MTPNKNRTKPAPGAKMSQALARVSGLDAVLAVDAERVVVNLRPSGHVAFTVFEARTGGSAGGVFSVE